MEGRAGLSRRSASEGGGEEALRGRLPFQILKSQISNAPGAPTADFVAGPVPPVSAAPGLNPDRIPHFAHSFVLDRACLATGCLVTLPPLAEK